MRKAIAIDFDGCLCTDAHPAIGQPNWDVISRAKQEQRDGAGLILWTCREGDLLQEAVDACRGWGLIFDAVNESLPDWIEAFSTRPRKVGASEYWDDRAVRMGSGSGGDAEYLREIIHIYEKSNLIGSFTPEGLTAAYVAGLAALYKTVEDLTDGDQGRE